MRGQILAFSEQKAAGAIAAADEQRFLFHASDWRDVIPPERGMEVEFTATANNRAHQVRMAAPAALAPAPAAPLPQPPAPVRKPKRKSVLTLWALFLGWAGAHRFYMGAWGWGLVQLFGVPLVIGIVAALLPPLGGLLYLVVIVLIWAEVVRYIWLTDAEFDAKAKAYRPAPFAFFW